MCQFIFSSKGSKDCLARHCLTDTYRQSWDNAEGKIDRRGIVWQSKIFPFWTHPSSWSGTFVDFLTNLPSWLWIENRCFYFSLKVLFKNYNITWWYTRGICRCRTSTHRMEKWSFSKHWSILFRRRRHYLLYVWLMLLRGAHQCLWDLQHQEASRVTCQRPAVSLLLFLREKVLHEASLGGFLNFTKGLLWNHYVRWKIYWYCFRKG